MPGPRSQDSWVASRAACSARVWSRLSFPTGVIAPSRRLVHLMFTCSPPGPLRSILYMTVTGNVTADERTRVAEVVGRLQRRFASVDPERVADVVSQVHREFGSARVRDFVPVLVEKGARDRLKDLGL